MPNTQTADTLTDDTPIHVTEATSPHVYQQIALLVRWTLVGFGVGCLIGAAAIAAYTVFGATRLPDCRADACAITTQLATRLGWVVLLVAAAILIALLGYRRLSDNVAVDRGLRVATAFAGLAVVIDYRTSQFARVRDEIDVYFRTWEQMWTVSAAVLLLAIGAWTVALFASRRLRRPSWFDAAGLAIGLVAALLLSTTQFNGALRKGDDSQYVDATTASDIDVAPKPETLGRQGFGRILPYERAVKIVPAGAGFVVKKSLFDESSTPDVVAYDASGHERWHYQRTGPRPPDSPSSMSVSGLGVYADGRVVVLSLLGEHGLYVGLDAVTGAQLWTSTDPTLSAALDVSDFDYTSPHFVARDDGRWTAFDPHTGRRTWSIDDPVHCSGATVPDGMLPTFHGQHVYPVDTPTRVGAVIDCSTRDRVDLRLVTVDPSSGAVTNDKTLSALDGVPREDIQSWTAVAVPGTGAVILKLFSARRPLDAYIDSTGLRTDFPGPNPLEPIGDGMFTMRDGNTLRIYSGEALVQCDIPLGSSGAVDYAFLRDQVVVLDEQPHQLRVFNRAGCLQVGTVAVPPGFEGVTPARGVTLLTLHTGRRVVRTSVIGFAP
jgi:hypothetical protein